jgi:aryl sulfotransferase
VRYQTFVSDSARWDGYVPRVGDIVICTPPKCGTTWMQRICSLLIFQSVDLYAPLTTISPWLDMLSAPLDEVIATLDAQTHRRFIKTHVPLDGLPFLADVTYLGVGRDPRDVARSWDNHLLNMDLMAFMSARARAVGEPPDPSELLAQMTEVPADTEVGRFRQWMEMTPPIEANTASLQGVLHHQQTVWSRRDEPNVHLFHYSDLSADLGGQMRRLAHILEIPIDEGTWPTLVEAATFSAMKERAAELAPESTIGLWHDAERFFNRGESGAWRDIVTADDLARYDERVADLAEPDLAAWLHR